MRRSEVFQDRLQNTQAHNGKGKGGKGSSGTSQERSTLPEFCPHGFRKCTDGTLVSRDLANNCEFPECEVSPTSPPHLPSDVTQSNECSGHWNYRTKCTTSHGGVYIESATFSDCQDKCGQLAKENGWLASGEACCQWWEQAGRCNLFQKHQITPYPYFWSVIMNESTCSQANTGLIQQQGRITMDRPSPLSGGSGGRGPAPMIDMNAERKTAIDFTNNKHSDFSRQFVARPEWQKTLHCTTEEGNSCKECSTQSNCWTSKDKYRRAEADGSGNWRRLVDVIHVKCVKQQSSSLGGIFHVGTGNADKDMFFQLNLHDMRNGMLRLFWLSQQVHEYDVEPFESQAGDEGAVILTTKLQVPATQGGNELLIEFLPYEIAPAHSFGYLNAAHVDLWMPQNFLVCQDVKSCLSVFGDMTVEEIMLRNTNTLQKQCLDAEDPSSVSKACKDWRTCMEKGSENHAKHVSVLLEAAGVGNNSVLPELVSGKGGKEGKTGKGGESTSSEDEPSIKEGKGGKEGKTGKGGESTSSEDEASIKAGKKGKGGESNSTEDEPSIKAGKGGKGGEPTSSSICMNPETEDPESWDCDCYDKMKRRCDAVSEVPAVVEVGYSEVRCLRSIFCNYKDVCEDWIDKMCNDPDLDVFKTALDSAALMQLGTHSKGLRMEDDSIKPAEYEADIFGKLSLSEKTQAGDLDSAISFKSCG